jgi:MoxR-like ATPase
MFAMFQMNDKVRVVATADHPGLDENKVVRRLASGLMVELADEQGLQGVPVDLASITASLRDLITQVSSRFEGREELVEAFVTGMVAGEHTCVLGPPGTAKTSVASTLTKAIAGKFWRVLMNPDTTKDSLLGTIDPQALQNGKWTRRWSGLATAEIAVVDEVWKSSGQNANIMLDALEERRVREGDDEAVLPLISVLGMSNEVPEDSERQAIYDRFLIRLTVQYIKDADSFEGMLTSDAGATEVKSTLITDDLRLLSGVAEVMALEPGKDLLNVIKALWKEVGLNGRSVSDRRWKKTVKLACAYALLNQEVPAAHHAMVARWTLWTDLDEEAEIRKLVMSKTDPHAASILNVEAQLADLQRQVEEVDATSLEAKQEVAAKAGKLVKKANELINAPGIEKYQDRLKYVVKGAKQAIEDAVMKT